MALMIYCELSILWGLSKLRKIVYAKEFLKKHAAEFEIKVIARLIPFPLKLHTTPFNHHSDGQSITIELESEKKII